MKYPRKLSSGANNTVIVLSDTEVAKLYLKDTRSDIGSEAEKMKCANGVNRLVVRFVRLDYDEGLPNRVCTSLTWGAALRSEVGFEIF